MFAPASPAAALVLFYHVRFDAAAVLAVAFTPFFFFFCQEKTG